MIAGGVTENESYLDSVVEYDIDANTYNQIQSLPSPLRRSTLVKSNGFMYNFGGYKSNGLTTVSR